MVRNVVTGFGASDSTTTFHICLQIGVKESGTERALMLQLY
jgi:hypothetical protein